MAHRRTQLVTPLLLLAILLGGGWSLLRQPETPEGPVFSQVQVQRKEIRTPVSATGTFNPVNTVQAGRMD